MNNDEKVRVSLEQALEMQNALRRNGLTLEDLKLLTSGQNMTHALAALRILQCGSESSFIEGSAMLWPLDKIFTEEIFVELDLANKKALSNRRKILTRTLFTLRRHNFSCVGDLLQKSKRELLSLPDMGEASLRFIEEVLKKHNLSLGMKLS